MCENIPSEVLEHILTLLPPKDLCTCRVVCSRWKKLIDHLTRKVKLWCQHCRKDYPDIYNSTYQKSWPNLSWYFLYKSLTLWPKLQEAQMIRYDFAEAIDAEDNIFDFHVLRDGVIGVHRRDAIVYYDLYTLKQSRRKKNIGTYLYYRENDNILLTLTLNKEMFVTWKAITKTGNETKVTIQKVKAFHLLDNIVYYATFNNVICSCKLIMGKINIIKLVTVSDIVASLGYQDGYLYILTMARTIYKLVGDKLITELNIEAMPITTIYSKLRKYNFQKETVFSFINSFYEPVVLCDETMCLVQCWDKTILYSHGHVIFTGSQYGNVCIYYAPDINNLLDIVPLQHINLMDSYDYFTRSMSEIIQIHVVESYNSHVVLIAMRYKITVLKFIHRN